MKQCLDGLIDALVFAAGVLTGLMLLHGSVILISYWLSA